MFSRKTVKVLVRGALVCYNLSFSVAAGIGTFFTQNFTQKISINAGIKSEPELSYQKDFVPSKSVILKTLAVSDR